MLIIEFDSNLKEKDNMVFYRDIKDIRWNMIKIDMKTLNLLVSNFGYNAMYVRQALDSYSYEVDCKYYNAGIKLVPKGIRNIGNMPDKSYQYIKYYKNT